VKTTYEELRRRTRARAFTLIEVTLALGVAGFCLITLFGLLPVGLTSNQASLDQTVAANIASAIVSDLRSTQSLGAASSPRFGISIPAPATSGTGSPITTSALKFTTIYLAANGSVTSVATSGSAAPIFRATVAFGTPGPGNAPVATARYATPVRVFISWPALADSNPNSWPVNYSGSYEADTTLDRN
jgi:uncharacterized protein (TIGR02598 family)